MRNNIFLKIAFCVTLLSAILLFAGCSSQEEETPAAVPVNITITIDYPKISKVPDLKETPFRVEEDTTVLEVIELYGTVNEIPVLVETTYSTLQGINNVQNDMYQKGYGWKYKINGSYQKKPLNSLIVKEGDHVEFVYVSTK